MSGICYSGGAEGADKLFGELAIKAGHDVVHQSFAGHKTKVEVNILNQELLSWADAALILANKTLKRTFPTKSEHTNNLLRRNYFQIATSKRIYAVCGLDENGIPYGGTAWAIIMGINMGIKEIYVFDQDKDKWFAYKFLLSWDEINIGEIPTPCGLYTGIGSRDLKPNGRKAIESLYEFITGA